MEMHSPSLRHIIGVNAHAENGRTCDSDVVMTYFLQLEMLPASSFAPHHRRSTQRCARQFLPLSHSTPSHRPNLWLFLHRSGYTSLAACPVISFHACCKCFCPTDSEESRLRNKKGWVWRMHQVRLRHCMLQARLDTNSCGELVTVYLLYLFYVEQRTRKGITGFRTYSYDHTEEYTVNPCFPRGVT